MLDHSYIYNIIQHYLVDVNVKIAKKQKCFISVVEVPSMCIIVAKSLDYWIDVQRSLVVLLSAFKNKT